MEKQDSNYSSHGCGGDQEHVSVFKLLRGAELEDEAVVYPRLSPREDVASEKEQVQKQYAKYAAKLQPKKEKIRLTIMVLNMNNNLVCKDQTLLHLPENWIDCFHVHRV